MSTCTFSDCSGDKPTIDPVVLDLHKGSNARFYRYATNVLRYDRVKDRQKAVQECHDGDAACPIGAKQAQPIEQVLSVQPTYDANGVQTNSMLKVPERNRFDYAAFYPEGEIKEASDRVNFLHTKQRHPRQCNLHGNMCGDTSLIGARQVPSGTALTPAQAARTDKRGFDARFANMM